MRSAPFLVGGVDLANWTTTAFATACACAVPLSHSSAPTQRQGCPPYSARTGRNAFPDAPSRRSGYSMAYDAHRHRIVLYGGSDSIYDRLSDTWEWDGTRWRRIAVAGPGPRSDAQIAYDAKRRRVVLFGGSSTGGVQGDTWTYDGVRWILADTGGPPARNLGAAAFDAARGVVVLFGGSNAHHDALGDTWEWNGQSWTRRSTAGPEARGSHGMVYDPVRRSIMLVAGYADSTMNDAWEWQDERWTRLPGNAPVLLHFAVAYDPDEHKVVVFGGFAENGRVGDTWTWDGRVWQQANVLGPSPRAEHSGAYMPHVGFVIFGGIGGQGMSIEERGAAKLQDTWVWHRATWRQMP